MPVTLDQLVAVRSQLAQGLRAYLQAVIDLPNQERPAYLGAPQMTDLYVSPDVLEDEHKGQGADRRLQQRAAASLAEEEQGRFARDEDENRRTRVAWERERRTLRRAVILGVPGSGKTLLARMTARAVAEASLAALDEQKTGVRELDLPMCVRVADVAREGALAPAISAVVRAATARALTIPPDAPPHDEGAGGLDAVVRHIGAVLETEHGWLFLDALDEVPDRGPLKAALELLHHARCHVVVTCRPDGYDGTVLPWPFVPEYELAPFASEQRREFISRWFRDDPAPRLRLLRWVEGDPELGDPAGNALLLTAVCRLVGASPVVFLPVVLLVLQLLLTKTRSLTFAGTVLSAGLLVALVFFPLADPLIIPAARGLLVTWLLITLFSTVVIVAAVTAATWSRALRHIRVHPPKAAGPVPSQRPSDRPSPPRILVHRSLDMVEALRTLRRSVDRWQVLRRIATGIVFGCVLVAAPDLIRIGFPPPTPSFDEQGTGMSTVLPSAPRPVPDDRRETAPGSSESAQDYLIVALVAEDRRDLLVRLNSSHWANREEPVGYDTKLCWGVSPCAAIRLDTQPHPETEDDRSGEVQVIRRRRLLWRELPETIVLQDALWNVARIG